MKIEFGEIGDELVPVGQIPVCFSVAAVWMNHDRILRVLLLLCCQVEWRGVLNLSLGTLASTQHELSSCFAYMSACLLRRLWMYAIVTYRGNPP